MKCKPCFLENYENFTKCILLILFFHGDNLPEMSKPVLLGQNKKKYFKIFSTFLIFSKKTRFDISFKLPPMETICLKCQNLFSWKNKKLYYRVIALILVNIVPSWDIELARVRRYPIEGQYSPISV